MRGNLSTEVTWNGSPAAWNRRWTAGSTAGSTGPWLVQATLLSTPNRPSRLAWCALPACAGLGSDGLGRVDVSGVPAGESPDETHEREHEPLDQWWDRPATELAVVATE